MATRNLSFEEILEEKPTLDELCEHIRIGSKWYQLGIQLKLNAKKLEDIHKLPDDSKYKTTNMFELWLDTKPDATRRQVIDTLRKELMTVAAHEYEQILWKSCSLPTRMDIPGTKASAIFQSHTHILPHTKQPDISDLLRKTPTKHDLLKLLADISHLWHVIGLSLNVTDNVLFGLKHSQESDTIKLSEVIHSWLTTTESSWETLIDAIKGPIVKHIRKANEIHQYLTTVKENTLQSFIREISQSQINPVKVSQLLFSERSINEETLDKMESLQGSPDEKKMTLLSAIYTAISVDHKKLKVLATVLSKFEETKTLSERIISEYSQTFPDDQITVANVQEVVMTSYSSHEDHASDILRCHYGTLSQSLQYPVRVAEIICGERVISQAAFSMVKRIAESYSEAEALFVLLRAIRHAIHSNYSNLGVFASVLLKLTSNVPCANAILKDYEKTFFEDKSYEVQHVNTGVSEVNSLTSTSGGASVDSSLTLSQDETKKEVVIPVSRKFKSVLAEMRKEYAITFSNIREAINTTPPPLDKLKQFLRDGYSYLKSQIAHSTSIDDVLDVVNNHCTLINISCLEGIVTRFKIKEAETHIQAYKDVVQSFCEKTKASLCLNENFKVTNTPSLLKCETAVFVLDWDPKDCTLEEINDIISESVEGNVQIRVIRKGNSIIVTCFFPLNLTTLLIARAQETLESVKRRGLIQLTVGHCTIYDKYQRDKEVRPIVEENTKELRSYVELEQTISKKKTMELSSVKKQNEEMRQMKEKDIEDLTSQLRDRDKQNETLKQNLKVTEKEKQRESKKLQDITTSLTLQLRERDEQIEELKQSLKATEKELFSVEKQREIEEQQKITLTLQLRDKDKENETLKQSLQEMKEKQVKDMTSLPERKEVIEKEFVSMATERQKEIEKLQDITTSLTLQLRERDKQIEELKQSLKVDVVLTSKTHKPLTDQGFEETQTKSSQEDKSTPSIIETTELKDKSSVEIKESDIEQSDYDVDDKQSDHDADDEHSHIEDLKSPLSGQLKEKSLLMTGRDILLPTGQQQRYQRDTGSVLWNDDDNIVRLTRPSVLESEDVISKLIKEQQTGKEWSIYLWSSSPESTAVIINNLNKCTVRYLEIYNTSLDSKCVSILSEILKTNKTIKRLQLSSSSLTGGIKQVSDSLFNNKTLEQLVLYNVTDITDEDITHLSTMLSSNTTLKELYLFNCNITDNGVRYICEGLTKNQTLTTLDIRGNRQITSVSTSTIADLIQTTTSLTTLYLYNTSLNNDDIKTICTSLNKNTTIRELVLSRQHREYCTKLDCYQVIKDRLVFV